MKPMDRQITSFRLTNQVRTEPQFMLQSIERKLNKRMFDVMCLKL